MASNIAAAKLKEAEVKLQEAALLDPTDWYTWRVLSDTPLPTERRRASSCAFVAVLGS